jgi:ribonuclease-3
MYLDKGYTFTKKYFITNVIEKFFDIAFLEANDTNYKSQLLEIVQKRKQTVVFNSEETELSETDNVMSFVATVAIDNVIVATAKANTKKEAEQRASKIAIESITTV